MHQRAISAARAVTRTGHGTASTMLSVVEIVRIVQNWANTLHDLGTRIGYLMLNIANCHQLPA
jgi:hypothetical protein